MKTPALTAVLCIHGVREAPLTRVRASLAAQTLARDAWEWIVVDNANEPPLEVRALEIDGLVPRLVREPRLGLTRARCAGIRAARGDVLVFVDDDTVLDPEYLARALSLLESQPHVGAAGGRIRGEFEREPPAWMSEFLGSLAIRDFGDRPIRALVYNEVGPWEPCGAGLVIRTSIAAAYAERVEGTHGSPADRVGEALSSCGDTDLARTATDHGAYLAYEPDLRITHLISRQRLTLSYLARIGYCIQRDGWALFRRRGKDCAISTPGFLLRCAAAPLRTFGLPVQRWVVRTASKIGELRGRQMPIGRGEGASA